MSSTWWVRPLVLVATCSLATVASAQNGGREGEGNPPPVYTPPPTTVYQPPPGYGAYATPPPPTGPKRMAYEEGDPVPPGYHVSTHTRTGLLIGGGITFGVFYGLTVMGASGSSDSDTKYCYIPVVGPVLYGNTIQGDFAFIPRFFLWIDALAQAAGATMLAVGSIPKTELVRNDLAKVHVSPIVTANTTGLAFTGVF